ncbi:hypothetical protein C4D60_Mb11t23220 [Musa balbisiana]|uniref:Uncharacterized protein n=1 Tax=Musa balbisiana TaxID=52838 RepID=A0A4S8J668_MUSBA|nr:hypothetical protein C4D60_Mb11t23220 [Musa balbisiana]
MLTETVMLCPAERISRGKISLERSASKLVHGGDRDEGGEDVHDAADHCRREGGLAAEADGFEEHGSIEHDDINAGELLEEGDQNGYGELRPVLPLQYVGPRVVDALGLIAGRHEVVVLVSDVFGATDFAEHGLGLFVVAALDERVGSVGQHQRADGDDEGRDRGEPEADAPSPATFDRGCPVVDDVGGEDSDGDHELEADVKSAPEISRCHLGEVERHSLHASIRQSRAQSRTPGCVPTRTGMILLEQINRSFCLIREANADAEEDTAEDEHLDVHGGAVDGGAEQKGYPSGEHGPLPPEHPRHRRRKEG